MIPSISMQRCTLPLLLGGCIILTVAVSIVDAFTPSCLTTRVCASQLKLVRQSKHRLRQACESSNELLSSIDNGEEGQDDIKSKIQSLEASFLLTSNNNTENEDLFEPLLGLYEVKTVITNNPKDNPVGGKWTRSSGIAQKLFRTRATFQHLLPNNATGLSQSQSTTTYSKEGEDAVAEAINVVSLEAIDGLLRATVILRGDAVPLTSIERTQMNANRTITKLTKRAVRAYFDPPRIYFGKRINKGKKKRYAYLPLQIGPPSSVVLDTTYYDDLVRIGMGGTSGSRFVFASTDVEEAKEYESLLKIPYAKKWNVLGKLGAILVASLYVSYGSSDLGHKLGQYSTKVMESLTTAKIAQTVLQVSRRMRKKAPLAVIITSYPVVMRILAGITSVLSGIAIMLILFSSGGIERDGVSRKSESPSP